MPTNVYFDTGTVREQELYEDLIIEQLRIYGQDVYYIPRNIASKDSILGEEDFSTFDDAYLIEMYIENVDGYEGQKELMSQFGLEIRDETTFIVSRRRWEQFVSQDSNLTTSTRPNEGDLIYFPKGKRLFEIGFVDHDDPFYQVHNLPTYKLKCRTFEYGSEDFDTGISEIDGIDDALSIDSMQHQFTMEQSTAQNENITIQHAKGSYGVLLEETSGDNITMEDDSTSVGESILLENDTDADDSDYLIQEDYIVGDGVNDKSAQNAIFDTQDDNVLDFTESNPFGDPGVNE
mgnify:FL=1